MPESLISSQAITFDYLRMPWTYDPNLGPLVAVPEHNAGDGMYRYVMQEGKLAVERNPHPTEECEFRRRFDASIERTMRRVREQQQRDELDGSDDPGASSDEFCTWNRASHNADAVDSDDEFCNNLEAQNESSQVRKYVKSKSCSSSRRSTATDKSSIDALLVERGCIFASEKRESNGRMDIRIHHPESGKRFRSRLEAMRFLGITVDPS